MLRRSMPMRYLGYTTILGFTGGIASGKSSRCQHLLKIAQQKVQQPGVSLGVAYINADVVGHALYTPGHPCFTKVLDAFGRDAIQASDGSIDRRRLGALVFGDKRQMQLLNSLVWPHIDEALHTEIETKCEENTIRAGNKSMLIILEAAVLIEQGFVKHCHDVWITSCNKSVAVERIMSRNGLTKEEALIRVESQMTVEDRLSFLRSSGFAGSIQHFDTSEVTVEAGLRQVSTAFDNYWTTKLRPAVREIASHD